MWWFYIVMQGWEWRPGISKTTQDPAELTQMPDGKSQSQGEGMGYEMGARPELSHPPGDFHSITDVSINTVGWTTEMDTNLPLSVLPANVILQLFSPRGRI